jgi:hypothetical protein
VIHVSYMAHSDPKNDTRIILRAKQFFFFFLFYLFIFLFEDLVLTSSLDVGKYSCNVKIIILSNTPLDIKLK